MMRTIVERITLLRPEKHDLLVLTLDAPLSQKESRVFQGQLRAALSERIPGWNGIILFLQRGQDMQCVPARHAQTLIDALFGMPWADEKSLRAIAAMLAIGEE